MRTIVLVQSDIVLDTFEQADKIGVSTRRSGVYGAVKDKSSIKINLQTPIRNVRSVRLLGGAIPNTVYNLPIGGETFVLQLESKENIVIIMTVGRFSLDEFMEEFQNQLNRNSRTGTSIWKVEYNHVTFRVSISNNLVKWRFEPVNVNNMHLLGFTFVDVQFMLNHSADQAPKMNSNKFIGIRIAELPGGVEIPNLGCQYTFVIPFPSVSETITYLGRDSLRGQEVCYNQNGIDVKTLTVELMQTELLLPLMLQSDWSIMLEITSSDDFM